MYSFLCLLCAINYSSEYYFLRLLLHHQLATCLLSSLSASYQCAHQCTIFSACFESSVTHQSTLFSSCYCHQLLNCVHSSLSANRSSITHHRALLCISNASTITHRRTHHSVCYCVINYLLTYSLSFAIIMASLTYFYF